jgi:TRAP-type mannitol/chloroaromatic compound transport system permease small subunit
MSLQPHRILYIRQLGRFFALGCVFQAFAFLLNNYLIFWQDFPGPLSFLESQFGVIPPLENTATILGAIQTVLLASLWIGIILYTVKTPLKSLRSESEQLSKFATYLCRGSFWAVFLIGCVDMSISFLRVEGWLASIVGKDLALELARSNFRGTFIHYPLIFVGFAIALRHKGLGFIWFTYAVVIAEFLIVLSRFVYSYEQAFMGDLVRMWYAALFLFASANALVTEGHVRVDVFYANMKLQNKALSNALGSVLLGLPLCWVILLIGMWDKGSSINSPLRSFEISQQGFGMYVKYLMVGFLVVFALTMLIQFCSFFLENLSLLLGEKKDPKHSSAPPPSPSPA